MSDPTQNDPKRDDDFSEQAKGERQSLGSEFVQFLGENKKWWLAPILITIVGLGALVALGGTAAAPFIYTLF